ncbi:enoyl-CoA hydratase/isomerase family protein [Polaromonas sp.]|uniref:enoyl-CoA hydratase/isomerase family protein n=1 Tax=Polaromonas sp. TaxID=1869339 RepID=UPI00352A586F
MADIELQHDGRVRIITMNRPKKKNALTQEMYLDMAEAVDDASSNTQIKAIVLTGSPEAFTAGNDISNFLARGTETPRADENQRSGGMIFLDSLLKSTVPIVAAIEGMAIGIGTTMLFHCDYVVASNEASFTTPFVGLGLIPEAASTLLAPAALGYRKAFEMLVMGRRMTAHDCYRAGFVNEVVESGAALKIALIAAQHIASLPTDAVAITRQLMRSTTAEIGQRMELEAKIFRQRVRSPEAIEAFQKFLSK